MARAMNLKGLDVLAWNYRSCSGELNKTLAALFGEVRDASKNYTEAQKHLNLLAGELDPAADGSEFPAFGGI